MFTQFWEWLKSLFGFTHEQEPKEVQEVEEVVQTFDGWIKDEEDTRDQVFTKDQS